MGVILVVKMALFLSYIEAVGFHFQSTHDRLPWGVPSGVSQVVLSSAVLSRFDH